MDAEEAKLREELKRRSENERSKWPPCAQVIRGIKYDSADPATRLIGYRYSIGYYIGEKIPPYFPKRLYRTQDAKYFIHKKAGNPAEEIEPIDIMTAHTYMDYEGCDQYITEAEKIEIKRNDELRQQ